MLGWVSAAIFFPSVIDKLERDAFFWNFSLCACLCSWTILIPRIFHPHRGTEQIFKTVRPFSAAFSFPGSLDGTREKVSWHWLGWGRGRGTSPPPPHTHTNILHQYSHVLLRAESWGIFMLVVLRDLTGSCGQLARKEKNNFWSSFPTFKPMMKARHSQVE